MTTQSIKDRLSPTTRQTLGRIQRSVLRFKELLLGGGERRESILLELLGSHYRHRYRREWELCEEEPHFFSQRIGLFEFAFGAGGHGPYAFNRGFFVSDLLRNDDRLLDIGCGEGFFARRFFAERCAHIDAIDIEPSAIQAARAQNSAPNIAYHLLDAVNEPFPGNNYDVIVWDGALGHFAPNTTNHMLEKIKNSLSGDGIFVGSESLGVEGSDHLQFFDSLGDLHSLFAPYFKYIELRAVNYRTGREPTSFMRSEGYWRCANNQRRLAEASWISYASDKNGTAESETKRIDISRSVAQ
jgi:SAM-dependent methyltransferase